MGNLISVSSAPIAKLGKKRYYDLPGTLEVMNRIYQESDVDGFELQLQPEWDNENPPLTDAQYADWTKTPKYTSEELLKLVRREKLPILSVHASRDVGSYLCSDRKRDLKKGKRLISESLSLAEGLGTKICVFHLWDTWKARFNLNRLKNALSKATSEFPEVKASVENIPTSLKGHTPLELAKSFNYVTLDLKWATLYDELSAFESIIHKIVNVHLHATLQRNGWLLDRSPLGFHEVLAMIRDDWNYSGLFTVEPGGKFDSSYYNSFLESMKPLRKRNRPKNTEQI